GDADASRYRCALEAIRPAEDCDAALVILTVQAATDASAAARAIVGSTRDWDIPLVTAFVGGPRVRPGVRTLEESHVPCLAFPERAVSVLVGMARVAERRREGRGCVPPRPELPEALARSLERCAGRSLGMAGLEPLLAAYGIPVVRSRLAAGPAEAASAAAQLGVPVALKVVSAEISHKTDVGGVRLGLGTPAEVMVAAETMLADVRRARPDATVQGLLVQAMAAPGRELLLGMTRDPQFGPLMIVGFGGHYVEVLGDIAARLAPVSEADAVEMLGELRMAPALRAFRGVAAVDCLALARVISRFSRLLTDLPMLSEIELNPLVARPDGVLAVDARATVDGSPFAEVRE
ncbi:MAG TPA: acetate--CoA ligase family protein, partial [Methylomirabilota bacterium]